MRAHFIIYRLDAPSIVQSMADVLDILQTTALKFDSGPLGTRIQGELEEVMAAICLCHRRLARAHRILTSIVIEDEPITETDTKDLSFHKESQPCKVSS